MFRLIQILLIAVLAQNVASSRILAVVPTASYSHQMFFQPLWRELAMRGHDMVVITTDPTNETLPNFKEISIRESYGPMKEFIDIFINTSMFRIMIENKWADLSINLANYQLAIPEVKQLIDNKTEHFDLLMIEHFPSPMFGFRHRFNCPSIGVLSIDGMISSHEVMGNPVHTILYPSAIVLKHETFFDRLIAMVWTNLFEFITKMNLNKVDLAMRTHFKDESSPHYSKLFEDTDMLFVNANPVFVPVRPLTPSTISIAGGMHMKPPKSLPKELAEFLDKGTKGVVYFSLGSNVKSKELSPDLRKTIIETLSQLPYQVLWKFEDDTLPGKPPNVMITKWAPQQDVLRHKNVKVFITQGGVQSLEEALYTHVPVVAIPFFGDQASNAEKLKSKGIGLVLDRYNLKTDTFKEAIVEVMENPVYRETIKLLATRIQDEPMSPLEKAVWWTEYVLRHNGAQHLKGPKIPLYQYYYLDVLGFLALVMVLLVGGVVLMLKYVINKVRCILKQEPKPKNSKVKKS